MYILSAICSDYALASVLGIIKRIITILQIVVPIFLIIGGSITFSKALINPDDGPKAKKNFLNAIASAVIVFLMPFLINSIMAIISAYGDVGITDSNGNNTAFNISSCWSNANVTDISSSSISNYNENTSISDEANGNTRTNSNTNTNNRNNNNSSNNSNSQNNNRNNSNNSNKNNKNNNTNSNSNKNNNSSSNSNNKNNNSKTDTSTNNYSSFVLVGDSRFVGQESSGFKNSKTTYIASVGKGLTYMKSNEEAMKKKDSKNTAYVINMGVNDLYNANSYVEYINKIAKNYKGDIYYLSVNPVEESKAANNGYSIKNSDIEKFNSTLKSGLKNVTYLDSYNYLKNNGFSTTDGIHYDKKTYQKIYSYINFNVK
jgi:GATA zinc finger domain-containing protein 15 (fragment)